MYVAILLGAFAVDERSGDAIRVRMLPDDVKRELMEYAAHIASEKPHPRDGVCLWFDEQTRKCRHYELRPSICRDKLHVGDRYCLRWRAVYADTILEGDADA